MIQECINNVITTKLLIGFHLIFKNIQKVYNKIIIDFFLEHFFWITNQFERWPWFVEIFLYKKKKMILKKHENNVKFWIWKMIWKKDFIFIFGHIMLQLHMVIGRWKLKTLKSQFKLRCKQAIWVKGHPKSKNWNQKNTHVHEWDTN